MKIALVSPYDYPYPGGVTNHVRHLQRELTGLGHEVRIMAPSSNRNLERGARRIPDRECPAGARKWIHRAGSHSPFGWHDACVEVLASEQFDVIHAHEPLMPNLPPTVLRYSNAVNIGTFHAYRGSYYGYFYGRPILRRVFDNLDGRIAVSARPNGSCVSILWPHIRSFPTVWR